MNHDYTPKWNEKFDNDNADSGHAAPTVERKSAVQNWMSESLLSPIIENEKKPEDTEKSTGKKKKRFLRLFKRSFSGIATTETKATPSFTESLSNSPKGLESQPSSAVESAKTESTAESQTPTPEDATTDRVPNVRQNEAIALDPPEFPPPAPEASTPTRKYNAANFEPPMINTPYQMARAETFAAAEPAPITPEQSMVNKKTSVSAAGAFFAAEFLSRRRDRKLQREARKLKKQLNKQQHELEKQKARHTELAQNVTEHQASKSKIEQNLRNSTNGLTPETSKDTFFVPPVLTAASTEQYSSNTDRLLPHQPETFHEETEKNPESPAAKTPESVDSSPEAYQYHLLAKKEKAEQERKKYEQHQSEQTREPQEDTRRDADFDRRHEILDDATKVTTPSVAASGSRYLGRAPVPIASVLKDRERVQSKQMANRSSKPGESSNTTQAQPSMYKQSVQYGISTALVLFAFVIAASAIL